MKVTIYREEGVVILRFEPPIYTSGGQAGTSVILDHAEYAKLEMAQRDDEAKQAAASGDFENESKLDVLTNEAWLDS